LGLAAFVIVKRPSAADPIAGFQMTHFILTNRNINETQTEFSFKVSKTTRFLALNETATVLDPKRATDGIDARTQWAKSIIDDAQTSKGTVDVVVMVHGFNTDASEGFAAHRAGKDALLRNGLRGAAVVSFLWPSDGVLFGYPLDIRDAKKSAAILAVDCIGAIIQAGKDQGKTVRLHLLGHSMGAFLILNMFSPGPNHFDTVVKHWSFENVIFFAADVSQRHMAGGMGQGLINRTRRMTNYASKDDDVLFLAKLIRFFLWLNTKRLGRQGLPASLVNQKSVVNVDVTQHWRDLQKKHNMDFVTAFKKSHAFYRTDDVFVSDLIHVMDGNADPTKLPNRQVLPDGRLVLV
ncbi:MAG: alpha/beta fold hydrolase, partial [Pseudomonadota bacterium]